MITSMARKMGHIALLFALVFTLVPTSSFAEPPAPSTTPTTTSEGAVDLVADTLPRSASETAAPVAPVATAVEALSIPFSDQISSADIAPAPARNALPPPAVVDVSVGESLRASDYISYTYSYRNDTSAPITDIEVQAIWTNFASASNGNWQFCPAAPDPVLTGCGLVPESIQGPSVTPIGQPDPVNGARYRIGALSAGQTGRFTVRLRTLATIHPRTGQAVTRLSSSAKLFTATAGGAGASAPTSEDTASSLVTGPVFVLTKTLDPASINVAGKIYPGETAQFIIRVGNATTAADNPGGAVRADARRATGIVLRDMLPPGGEYVSSTPTGVFTATELLWNAPVLEVGQTLEFRVTFRKLNVNNGCGRLNNNTYTVTSAEMPGQGINRLTVAGPGTGVDVVTPVTIKQVVSQPGSVVYGDVATIQIVVSSLWSQAITSLVLNYDVQTNGSYLPSSANPGAPELIAAPDGTQPGGRVSWRFDMPAATRTTAQERTFTIRVRAGYVTASANVTASLVVPTSIPAACTLVVAGRAGLTPRLKVSKTTPALPETRIDNAYIVSRGQEFVYRITVENVGVASATNVDITDRLPSEEAANFSYVVGSARVNGVLREPDAYTDGSGGILVWNDFTIAPATSFVIEYRLRVAGRDYFNYCNSVTAISGTEDISYPFRSVCVKINPQIRVSKTANKRLVAPSEEIIFTLKMTNTETQAYRVGLYDVLGNYTYVRTVSGYDTTAEVLSGNRIQWDLISLAPGQTVEIVFVATPPNTCTNGSYRNIAQFYNETNVIVSRPEVFVDVQVACSRLEYNLSANRSDASLQDRIVFNMNLRNANTVAAMANVTAEVILAQGFTYLGLEGGSQVRTNPVQTTLPTGQTKLVWTVPSIAINTTTAIRIIARSGLLVGQQKQLFTASAPGAFAVCGGACETIDAKVYTTLNVPVSPMITVEPRVVPTACTTPNTEVTYSLTLLNTNNHLYTTVMTATLPYGVSYVRSLNNASDTTLIPRFALQGDGTTLLTWSDIVVPARVGVASQVVLQVVVKPGQVWGNLVTVEQATSPDGAIPRKDGAINNVIKVCPATLGVAKEAYPKVIDVGSDVLYLISLANTTNVTRTVAVQDILPPGMTFVQMVEGPSPTFQGTTLNWNVTLPGQTNTTQGVVNLKFKARLTQRGTSPYRNTATVSSSGVTFDTRFASVDVELRSATTTTKVYLPFVRR